MTAALLGAGLGLKPEHIEAACAADAPGLWFEVHAENYLVDGGPRLRALEAVRSHHPLSLHGVSLSLAGSTPPDTAHLARLAALVRRVQPVLVSEHLAWSGRPGLYLPDLLPFVRDRAALQRLCDHIGRTQDVLGRRIAVENPSHYLALDGHDWSEPAFLAELLRRSGCALLLDLNNVFVSAHNLGFEAHTWLDELLATGAGEQVAELHLAGHSADVSEQAALLIDSHDEAVCDAVWALHHHFVERAGWRPTLIERDGKLPDFNTLMNERARAERELA